MDRILYDEPKRAANLAKHGFDFASLDIEYFFTAIIVAARADRLKAIGWHDGRLMAIVFRPLGTEAVSVISMRPASRQEKRLYEEGQARTA